METLSFILGMLSIFAVIVVAVQVWGVFKIVAITKQLRWANEQQERSQDSYYRELSELRKSNADQVNEFYRSLSEYERHILEASKSYTDSRIDKLLGKKEKEQITKSILKG